MTKKTIRYSLPVALLLLLGLTQHISAWSVYYAECIYPLIAKALSAFSSLFPFSVGDLFILLSILWLIIHPIYTRIKSKKPWKMIFLHSAEYLVWVYIWFYLAWGLNYSQPNFYQRANAPVHSYQKEVFQQFLTEYVDSLNNSYLPIESIDKQRVHEDIITTYRYIGHTMGVHTPAGSPRAKTMMFTPLFSKMAITGYMGPFFCEFNLNGELLPAQYASTYAHELAHFLGVTSEAEANFYAYQVCTHAEEASTRFCGYFNVLSYVLGNARGFLAEEEFKEVITTLRPEILELYNEHREFWISKYSRVLGEVQNWIYDLYLKGNKISSGRQNYSEVVGLLVSWWQYKKENNE